MTGFAILLGFNLLGLFLRRYGHIPLPENVLGMLLLLGALAAGLVKLEWVEDAAGFLLRHMMLFFAPYIVAVLPLVPVIEAEALPISGGLVASTLATLAVTAWTAQLLMREPRHVAGAAGERAGGGGRHGG